MPRILPPQITIYPGYGFQTDTGDWLLNVNGITYQTPPLNLRQKMLVKMLANMMKASEDELRSETFQNRIWPFFVEADKGQKIQISVADKTYRLKKKSRRNGHFGSWIRLERDVVEQNKVIRDDERSTLSYELTTTHPKSEPIGCSVELLRRCGLSVISDIDDTIKESIVTNRRELLLNTFVRDFRSVEGMSDVYRHWQLAGADFHYVSSSPWQLYQSLQMMQQDFGFPMGTMHLRNFRLRDQFLKKVMFRRKGKAAEINRLIRNLPSRKFLLVGDSGEKDPEIYQKICRKYPDQIKGLFIREISGRPMDRERLLKLRRSTGCANFAVFSSPSELLQQAESVIDQFASRLVTN